MYKYKKFILTICTFLILLLSLVELIRYLFVDSNIFGLVYLICNLFILFLLVPSVYNYKKYFSIQRISKFILIILFGLFNAYLLQKVVLNNTNVSDSSKMYIENIYIIKNILKPIIYFIILIITILEFKVKKLLRSNGKELS